MEHPAHLVAAPTLKASCDERRSAITATIKQGNDQMPRLKFRDAPVLLSPAARTRARKTRDALAAMSARAAKKPIDSAAMVASIRRRRTADAVNIGKLASRRASDAVAWAKAQNVKNRALYATGDAP
jgi:hypothetical protein